MDGFVHFSLNLSIHSVQSMQIVIPYKCFIIDEGTVPILVLSCCSFCAGPSSFVDQKLGLFRIQFFTLFTVPDCVHYITLLFKDPLFIAHYNTCASFPSNNFNSVAEQACKWLFNIFRELLERYSCVQNFTEFYTQNEHEC